MVGEPDYILIDFVILISGDCTSSCGRGERGCSPVQVQLASSSSRVQCSKTPNKAPNIQRHNPIKLLTESGPMSPTINLTTLILPGGPPQLGKQRKGGWVAGWLFQGEPIFQNVCVIFEDIFVWCIFVEICAWFRNILHICISCIFTAIKH